MPPNRGGGVQMIPLERASTVRHGPGAAITRAISTPYLRHLGLDLSGFQDRRTGQSHRGLGAVLNFGHRDLK